MKKNGFTLIELLITVTILGLLAGVILDLYLKSQHINIVQSSKIKLQINTRSSLDDINSYIKKSTSVLSSYTSPDNITYATSSNTLVLKVPSIDSSKNTISGVYDYVIFRQNPSTPVNLNKIIYKNTASSRIAVNTTIAKTLNSLEFVFYNSSNVIINSSYENCAYIITNITTREVVRGKTNTISESTKSKLRNK